MSENDTEEEAVAVWNTRKEPITLISPITTVSIGEPQPYVPLRTCKNIAANKDEQFLCSECRDSLWTGLDGNEIRYCPNCGAKVVE